LNLWQGEFEDVLEAEDVLDLAGVEVRPRCIHQNLLRKVDVRLPGKGDSNSHGARPVHLIITMTKWIRTSRLSIKNSLSSISAASKFGPAASTSIYRGTSRIRNTPPVGRYSSPMPRGLWLS